jgi:septal ring factor EnvC (AmiA/AmiB activator)
MRTGEDMASSPPSARHALVVVGVSLLLALLILTNLQLRQIADRPRESNVGGAVVAPPVEGTSNGVLSKQLHELSHNLSSPIDELRRQLTAFSGASAGQAALANSVHGVAGSVARLGAVQHELTQMTKALATVDDNTRTMADRVAGLIGGIGKTNATLSDTNMTMTGVGQSMNATSATTTGMAQTMSQVDQAISATSDSTANLGQTMSTLSQGISTMNQSMSEVGGGIANMRQSLAAMNQSLATTDTNTAGMGASLVTLNYNMEGLLDVFCVYLGSTNRHCSSG